MGGKWNKNLNICRSSIIFFSGQLLGGVWQLIPLLSFFIHSPPSWWNLMIEGLVPATGSPNSENVLGEYPYSTRGWVSLQYKGWQCCANIDFLYVTVGLVHIDRMHVLRKLVFYLCWWIWEDLRILPVLYLQENSHITWINCLFSHSNLSSAPTEV